MLKDRLYVEYKDDKKVWDRVPKISLVDDYMGVEMLMTPEYNIPLESLNLIIYEGVEIFISEELKEERREVFKDCMDKERPLWVGT